METNAEQIAVRAVLEINAADVPYRELNTRLRKAVESGTQKMVIRKVHGQMYIGANLGEAVEIEIYGTPGNELGAFMDGPRIVVHGDVADGCGNAMRSGEVIIHGHAGDNVGLSARGGKIFVRDDVGRLAGMHMKESSGKKAVVVIGGTAEDHLGEHLAGGTLVLLRLTQKEGQPNAARFIGNGMHGGVIYVRGMIEECQLGEGVGRADLEEEDLLELRRYVTEFARHFDFDADDILRWKFAKLFSLRPGSLSRLQSY